MCRDGAWRLVRLGWCEVTIDVEDNPKRRRLDSGIVVIEYDHTKPVTRPDLHDPFKAQALQHRLNKIAAIIEGVDGRAMAADGPVTKTRHEITDEEYRRIYFLAKGKPERRRRK
jgi:hypothetical protein